MKALKTIVLILVIIIGLILIVAFFLPSTVRIESSMKMNCSAESIFNKVNNFHNWAPWSPFAKGDTNMVIELEGSLKGEGSVMIWSSKDENGRMEIIDSKSPEYVKTQLLLMEEDQASSNWKFIEVEDGTEVHWDMTIENLDYPFGRWMGLFFPSIMKTIFDQGLENLHNLCQNQPDIYGLEMLQLKEQAILTILDSATMEQMSQKMSMGFGEIVGFMNAKKIGFAGSPFSAWYSWDEGKDFVFDCGIPVNVTDVETAGRINFSIRPAMLALKGIHMGSYEKSETIHNNMHKYIEMMGFEMDGAPWESYITDPMTEPDTSKWITEVFYPLK